MVKHPITIIIPAYNEESRIGSTLEEYHKFFNKYYKNKFTLLIVLNGCRDNTLGVVKKYAKKFSSLKYVVFEDPIGKGGAIIEGFKIATTELIGYVDADASTPAPAFYDLVLKIGSTDGLIASRWLKGSVVEAEQPLLRRVASRCFNLLIRLLFLMPYKDTQTGAKLFHKDAIASVLPHLGITQWAFDIDLIYQLRKRDYSVVEVPSLWRDKGESKLNVLRVSLQMFLAIVRLRLVHSPFSFVVDAYNSFAEFFGLSKW